MSGGITVKEFKHIPGVNDAEYIKKLEELHEIDKGIISKAVAKIKMLSAQPDIIHCKDCAYCDWDVIDVPYGITEKIWWCNKLCAETNENLIVEPDDFCSWAERREE